eukprot:5077178-Amphidinium_carterae.1
MLAARNEQQDDDLGAVPDKRLVYVSEKQYEAYYGMYAGRAFHVAARQRSQQSAPSASAFVAGPVG